MSNTFNTSGKIQSNFWQHLQTVAPNAHHQDWIIGVEEFDTSTIKSEGKIIEKYKELDKFNSLFFILSSIDQIKMTYKYFEEKTNVKVAPVKWNDNLIYFVAFRIR